MSSLQLRSLCKTYPGDVHVLRDVSLDVAEGEFCVFVGPSGCGKSTLLRMVAGLEDISAGDLVINGVHMNDVPPAQRGVAMVFQSYALWPHMTVAKNVAFGLEERRLPRRVDLVPPRLALLRLVNHCAHRA